jgi:hypothetical protein
MTEPVAEVAQLVAPTRGSTPHDKYDRQDESSGENKSPLHPEPATRERWQLSALSNPCRDHASQYGEPSRGNRQNLLSVQPIDSSFVMPKVSATGGRSLRFRSRFGSIFVLSQAETRPGRADLEATGTSASVAEVEAVEEAVVRADVEGGERLGGSERLRRDTEGPEGALDIVTDVVGF